MADVGSVTSPKLKEEDTEVQDKEGEEEEIVEEGKELMEEEEGDLSSLSRTAAIEEGVGKENNDVAEQPHREGRTRRILSDNERSSPLFEDFVYQITPLHIFSEESSDLLAEGFLDLFSPKLERMLSSFGKLRTSQEEILLSVEMKNQVFHGSPITAEIAQTLQKVPLYREKLVSISREMNHINKRVAKLKQRAVKLKELKESLEETRRADEAKRKAKEKKLEAKPVKR